MTKALNTKHAQAFSAKHLKPGETIIAAAEGYIGEMMGSGKSAQHNGVLIVTNDRVAFYRKGFLGEVIETIPLKSITSIERKSLMGHRTFRIHTSHDSLTFKTFDAAGETDMVDAIERGRGGAPADNSPADNSASDDPATMLRKLADLRDAGIVTPEEFAQKKSELLQKI